MAPVKHRRELWLPLALMVSFALTRIPGVLPLNFSAAYALAFCAGVYLPGRMAWWLPIGVLLLTDVLLNVFYYGVSPVSLYLLMQHVGYVVIILVGRQFRARSSFLGLLAGGLLGAVAFYLITNTAAWFQNPEYPRTLWGWIQALTTGLPGYPPTWTFFRNTLLSSGLFTAFFVGAMKLTEPKDAEEAEPEPAEAAEPEESKA